jgi:hypothetical protein
MCGYLVVVKEERPGITMYEKMTLRGPGQVKSKETCFFLHTYTIVLYSVHTRTHNKDQSNKEAGVCTVQ